MPQRLVPALFLLGLACAGQRSSVQTAGSATPTSEPSSSTIAVSVPEPAAADDEHKKVTCPAPVGGQRVWESKLATAAGHYMSDVRPDGSVSITTDDDATTAFCFTAIGEQTSPKDCELPLDPEFVKTPVDELPEGAHYNYAQAPDLLRPYLNEVQDYYDWYVPEQGGLVWGGNDLVQSLATDKSVRWQTKLKSDLPHAGARSLIPISTGDLLVLGHAYPDECVTPEGEHEVRRGFVAWLDQRGKLVWQATLKQCGWFPAQAWVRNDGSVLVQGWQSARREPALFTATISLGRILSTRAWDGAVGSFTLDADECLLAFRFHPDPHGNARVELWRHSP